MKGYPTTYVGMFDSPDGDRPAISSVRIPIIQRDYAQGRVGAQRIRDDFVSVLVAAASEGSADLDFVYGEVDASGVLEPLDGQQRLTTLFLLHWYVASRAGALDARAPWTRFAYATRPGAEFFCTRLVAHPYTDGASKPMKWITDQAWYLFPWRHDPTISAMLVMLDSIHDRFATLDVDFGHVWSRLQRRDDPAISFSLLPISDVGSAEDLYITMNSRGKPLTPFEVFKARLEKALQSSGRHTALIERFDREWSDLLWKHDDGDLVIDDEFMRYIEFIIDICEWRDGKRRAELALEDRARLVFAAENPHAEQHLDFFFHAFDTWTGVDSQHEFDAVFTTGVHVDGRVRLFESRATDLFRACLRNYGRAFSLTETLLLFAVLLHRQRRRSSGQGELAERLRVLRNLAESAPSEVRLEFMPALLGATSRWIVDGSLDDMTRFNQARVEDERRKQDLRDEFPDVRAALDELEDHPLLRGRLFLLDLDPEHLGRRATAFRTVFESANWPALTGALLACGDYSRTRSKYQQFGSSSPDKDTTWRDVLTAGSREQQQRLRMAVQTLLDDSDVVEAEDVKGALGELSVQFCAEREAGVRAFDWRYYLVKYPIMRSGPSGAYVAEAGAAGGPRVLGYSLCMLNTTTLGGYFRDPYLAAMREMSGVAAQVMDPRFIDQWEWRPRRMPLRSGVTLRCVPAGIEVSPPGSAASGPAFAAVCAEHGVDESGILHMPQRAIDDAHVDTEDRIQIGARLLRSLVEAGL